MGTDVAAKAEDSQTSLSSSSSSSSSRNSIDRSRSIQYSNNRRRSNAMAAGAEHSSTGAHHRVIYTGVMHECAIGVEGWNISSPNAVNF